MDWKAIASILAERSTSPLLLLDRHGHIRLINRAMEQALGWSRFQVEGQPWTTTCAASDRQDEARRWIDEALRGALRSYEALAVTHAGERIVLHFEFSLVGRGPARGLFAMATQVVPAHTTIGSMEGRDLDYEVSTEGDPIDDLAVRGR
jgi:PAS domain S-box-containing protein